MIQNRSLTARLTLYVVLTFSAILMLGLALNYYFTQQTLQKQLAVRTGNLADQISYSIEVLANQDDIFSIHRVVEQTALLEDVLTVAVIDRNGIVLSHNNKQLLNQPFADPLIEQAIYTEQRVEEFTRQRYAIADPLHGEKYDLQAHSDVIGVIWIEMDLASVRTALLRQYAVIATVMAGLLLLSGLMIMLIWRHTIIDRLHTLTNAVSTVSAGNLDFRLEVDRPANTRDEIASLMHHFNQMTASLQEQITQKLLAQPAQQKSDRQLAQVLDAAGDAIITIDANHNIIGFNRSAEAIFGYHTSEILNQSLNILLPPKVRPLHGAHLSHFAAKADKFVQPFHQRITLHAVRKNGELFPAEASLSKLNLNGNLTMTAILRDITTQKRAEAELRQSETNFRTFFDAVQDFLFIMDSAGNIQFTNHAVSSRLGYNFSEVLGQNVLMFHPPARHDEARRIVQGMLAGTEESCSVPLLAKDNHQIPVETRIYHGTWNGEPALFGISKDLSQIQASEEKFSRAFQANPTLMAISNLQDNRFMEVNNTFVEVTGYSRDELIGHSPDDLNLFHNPEDRLKAMGQIQQQGFARNLEVDIVTKTGEIRHGSFSADIINLQDAPYLLTVMNDITERKQAETQLRYSEARNRAVLNAIPDMIFRFNRHGRILDYKTPDKQSLYQSPEKFLGRLVFDILPPDVAELTRNHLNHLYETGQGQMYQYQLRGQQGTHTFEARLALIDNEESLAIVRDITEAARLEQMKTDFINRASHELRTPLTTAKIMIELIQEGGEEEELAEYWDVLQLELQRQQDLVEDLLTVGRLESGSLHTMTHAVELPPLLEESLQGLRQMSAVKGQRITVNLDPHLPRVRGEDNSLMRVFTNLLSNAIKFTPQGGQITVTAHTTPGQHVEITVTDTGIGIPQEDLPSLFGRFFRATNATQHEIPGSGIGLFMVKAMIEEMGGQISVTSQLNQGTTFTVLLLIEDENSVMTPA